MRKYSMALKPLNDRIIIEPSEAETRTASGLVLPDSAQEKPQRGKVLAVGPGKRLDNGTLAVPDVSVGDTVLYGKYSGTEVKLAGKEYVILRAEDILGILVGGGSAKPQVKKASSPAVKKPSKPAAKKPAAKPAAKKAAAKTPAAKKSSPKVKAKKSTTKTAAKPVAKPKPKKTAKPAVKPAAKAKPKKVAKKGRK
jgi:chaperonin GroES